MTVVGVGLAVLINSVFRRFSYFIFHPIAVYVAYRFEWPSTFDIRGQFGRALSELAWFLSCYVVTLAVLYAFTAGLVLIGVVIMKGLKEK